MRKGLSTITFTLVLPVVLTASACMTSTSSSQPRSRTLSYRIISHGDGFVVVRGHGLTLAVRSHQLYVLARDGRLFRVITRASRYVVLRRVPRAAAYVGRTFTSYTVPAGTHDVVYENCTFTGGSADVARGGVLTINRSCNNIVFRNCTVESGPGTGIKIVDAGGTVHDIRFEGCLVKSQPCMGFECISRPPAGVTAVYSRIDLVDCTFEPQGSEAVSYDAASSIVGAAGNCLIDGVVIKGSGTNLGAYPWGQGLEFNNIDNMTVRNTTIYRTGQSTLNLDTANSTFTDCTFDMSVNYIGAVSKGKYDAIVHGNITNCVFTRCTMKAADQGTVGLLSASSNNDFRTCTFSGASDFNRRVVQLTGCSGNLWPAGTLLQ